MKFLLKEILHKYRNLKKDVADVGFLLGCSRKQTRERYVFKTRD